MWCTCGVHVVYMWCTCGVHVGRGGAGMGGFHTDPPTKHVLEELSLGLRRKIKRWLRGMSKSKLQLNSQTTD